MNRFSVGDEPSLLLLLLLLLPAKSIVDGDCVRGSRLICDDCCWHASCRNIDPMPNKMPMNQLEPINIHDLTAEMRAWYRSGSVTAHHVSPTTSNTDIPPDQTPNGTCKERRRKKKHIKINANHFVIDFQWYFYISFT